MLHEAGHAVVANHLGMTVIAIGFSWLRGEHQEPNPSCWIPTDGIDKESVAVHNLAGVAAEIVKLQDYNIMSCNSDVKACRELGCTLSHEHYIKQAIEILKERDDALVRVYHKLMEERVNPSHEPFIDTVDKMKKQVHLTREEFESLL
jgi:hypothetical protein